MRYISTILACSFLIVSNSWAGSPNFMASQYLQLWQSSEYSPMYDFLSDQSKDYISRGEFIAEHRDFAREFIINSFEIIETINRGQTARVYYRLYLTRTGSGESVTKSGKLDLIRKNGEWRIR